VRPLLAALALALGLLGPATPPARGAEPGGPLPLVLVDAATGGPAELRPGAALLHLVFFATWCPPCREELPRLQEVDARWRDAGYRLVVIAVAARQSAGRVREFTTEHRVPGETLFDARGEAEGAFGADALPLHVLLDASGNVLRRAPRLDAELESAIHDLMTKHVRGR
jgi:thiol-disulfide isomerase/thioredoxin